MSIHEQFESAPLQTVTLPAETFRAEIRALSSPPDQTVQTISRNDSAQRTTDYLDFDIDDPIRQFSQNRSAAPEQPALSSEQPVLSSEQPVLLSRLDQINNLIRGEHGLNSQVFLEREAAQRQLHQSGTDALPAVLNALHDRSNLPLEVRRRLETFSNFMTNDRFNDLIAATRNNDPAIAHAAEVMISRETTDALLARPTNAALSPENQRTFNELIRTRLNDGQLQTYLQEPATGWTEAHLRRAVAAERVLGVPNGSDNQARLGVSILSRVDRTPAEQQYAERLLSAYTQNGSDPVLNASAHRLLAASAFQRGEANEGMRLMRNSMQLITGATEQTKRLDVLQELQSLSEVATTHSQGLNPAQRQELTALSRRATELGLAFVTARQQWFEQNNAIRP